ncbi:unnamed protein product [Closterium sp. Naga37s-1]|nr:unnamed protein product [Closterium sp. Naga37s-1]
MIARMAAEVAVWMGLAGVLAELLAWRVQKGFDDNRKAELDTWCAGRARPLQQQFISTSDHFKVADGRHAVDRRPSGTCSTTSRRKAVEGLVMVFGRIQKDPWGAHNNLTQRLFANYILRTQAARPWVHAIAYGAFVNGSERAVFERRMGCTPGDMQERPAPPADWYMDMRFWFDEQGPFPLVENSTTCSDGHLHPSYGPELTRMKITGAAILTTPYFLNNGHPGMAMMFPIFKGNVTAAAPWAERQAVIMGGMAVSVDFDRLAESIILEVLRQVVERSLEVYDVNPMDGPRLLYGVGGLDVPQGDPLQVAKIIPPLNETMLQPQRHKSVQQINFTDIPRTYQLWCRFQGSDEAHSMTAVFLGVIILVVAALLAAIGVSVTINMRRLREKTISMAILKEKAEVAERNKGAHIANTSPTHRLSCAPQYLAWKVRGNKVHG